MKRVSGSSRWGACQTGVAEAIRTRTIDRCIGQAYGNRWRCNGFDGIDVGAGKAGAGDTVFAEAVGGVTVAGDIVTQDDRLCGDKGYCRRRREQRAPGTGTSEPTYVHAVSIGTSHRRHNRTREALTVCFIGLPMLHTAAIRRSAPLSRPAVYPRGVPQAAAGTPGVNVTVRQFAKLS